MASLAELQEAVMYVSTHWQSSRAWSRPDALADDFRGVSASAIRAALEGFFRSGRERAPGPSEVLAAAIARSQQDGGPRVCRQHVWSRPGPADVDRSRWCVVCGESGRVDVCTHSWNGLGVCRYCPEVRSLGGLPGLT